MPDHEYWLLRHGFSLHQNSYVSNILEAQLTLYLSAQNDSAVDKVYAHSMFPTILNAEKPREMDIALRADLTFSGGAGLGADEPGARFVYQQTYPIIRGHGIGKCTPYWVFKPQVHQPLEGNQFVYAIIAAPLDSKDTAVMAELIVTVNTLRGPIRFGLPSDARARMHLAIPQYALIGA